ncbi:MAG TPA: glycoside hydrolase family 97 catalytic domain-containing protein [Acidobacteriaceae bacterium]
MKSNFALAAVSTLVLSASSVAHAASPESFSVTSPDGRISVRVWLAAHGMPMYEASFAGKPAILPSQLGFTDDLQDGFVLGKGSHSEHHENWKPVYGERSVVPDDYRELTVPLLKSDLVMSLTVRAYDGGFALRYNVQNPLPKALNVGKETTEFHLPAGTMAYEEHGTEGEYSRVPAGSITADTERPLTLEFANGLYGAILEAGTVSFPRMLLGPVKEKKDVLAVNLGGEASFGGPDGQSSSPWRLVQFGEHPGDLLEHDYLILDLNRPNQLTDTSWIKPGKVMREVTLSTDGAKAVIDFDAAHHFQYILFDAGWYGSEDPVTGDATQVRVNYRRPNARPGPEHPPLDLPWVLQYAREKGIGVWMYVDRRQMKSQRDVLLPLYEKWGVKGVKVGFVDVGPQNETAWVHETVRKAAEHHLMINIHDQFRTTGYTRTYPNLLTVEGVRGNEHFPTAQHDATLPFTRYLAGSADYTVCYYDGRLRNTHAHQLAMMIISYSPLQSVLWYDKPAAFGGEPEIKWFEETPTVWDETHVVAGEIGKVAAIARRSGQDWFVGVVNGMDAKTLPLPLKFLPRGKRFRAEIYSDDPAVTTKTHIKVATETVTSMSVLTMNLLASGGEAVHLTPLP